MSKRTGTRVGPSSYYNNPFRSIEAKVNSSHHTCAKPLMGAPVPKNNTVTAFNGTLLLYDDTFASLKWKQENPPVKGATLVAGEKAATQSRLIKNF